MAELRGVCWLVLLSACTSKDLPPTDDSSAPLTSPCSDGLWGSADPTAALQVRADGDDGGDGSVSAPFASLEAAIEAGRASGAAYAIFLGPGDFVAHMDLDGATDPGVYLGGCGAETVLAPEERDETAQEFALRVAAVPDLTLERLQVEGGERPLWIWEGTQATLRDVEVYSARRTGILYDGVNTFATMENVSVHDTIAVDIGSRSIGYGVSVRNLSSFSMSGGGIYNSTGIGLVVDGTAGASSVSLTDVVVSGTQQDGDGLLGRGVHLQVVDSATFSGVSLESNYDTALFAVRAGTLNMSDVLISGIAASDVGTGETSGDGVVVTAIDSLNPNPDPASYSAVLNNNAISGADRLGVLFERVSAEVSDNTVSGSLSDLAAQDGAVITGAQAGDVVSVQGLGLNRESVALDLLTQ